MTEHTLSKDCPCGPEVEEVHPLLRHIREARADAWDEGHDAGQMDAERTAEGHLVWETHNPYRGGGDRG